VADFIRPRQRSATIERKGSLKIEERRVKS
jgi:hypothetical protein